MKKLLCLFMAAFCALTFAGCSDAVEWDAAEPVTQSASMESEAEAETPPDSANETSEAMESEPEDPVTDGNAETPPGETEAAVLDPDGSYTTKDDVAAYINTYGCLPGNFITKKEAEALGWPGGSLEPYAPGKCIGGNRFGNYEGLLPEKEGRVYTECDIDTLGAEKRGAKRIVFSNDGLIYYTEDHYESFELLYGEESS